MTGRRSTFVPAVPDQEHIEAAARLFNAGAAYADSDDLGVRKDYRPGENRLPVALVLWFCGAVWVVLIAGLIGLVR